jgi:hypothetical protein
MIALTALLASLVGAPAGVDLCIAVDRSVSVRPAWASFVKAVPPLIHELRQGDRVLVIAFGAGVSVPVDQTIGRASDLETVTSAMNHLQCGDRETKLATALRTLQDKLSPGRATVVVLLTDGLPTSLRPPSYAQEWAARDAVVASLKARSASVSYVVLGVNTQAAAAADLSRLTKLLAARRFDLASAPSVPAVQQVIAALHPVVEAIRNAATPPAPVPGAPRSRGLGRLAALSALAGFLVLVLLLSVSARRRQGEAGAGIARHRLAIEIWRLHELTGEALARVVTRTFDVPSQGATSISFGYTPDADVALPVDPETPDDPLPALVVGPAAHVALHVPAGSSVLVDDGGDHLNLDAVSVAELGFMRVGGAVDQAVSLPPTWRIRWAGIEIRGSLRTAGEGDEDAGL